MKRILLTALLTCIFGTALLHAQEQRGERIEALKVAFLTRQLQLTPDEAQKFWPVYNVYDNEMKNMIKDHRQKGGSEIELEEKVLGLHKKYKPDFLKVISEDKFNKLMSAEKTWNEMLRKELQRRSQGGGGAKQFKPA